MQLNPTTSKVSIRPELSVLQKATRADIKVYPFPHLVIRNALPQHVYDVLALTRPSYEIILDGRDPGENKRIDLPAYKALEKDIDPFWIQFITYHTSQHFWNEVLDLFADHIMALYPKLVVSESLRDWRAGVRFRDLCQIRMECQPGVNTPSKTKSSVRGPHLDNPVELYGALLYMRHRDDRQYGGDFLTYKLKRSPVFHGKLEIDESCVEELDMVEYIDNTLVFFINTPYAIHGVSERSPGPIPRQLVSIAGEVVNPLFRVNHGKY